MKPWKKVEILIYKNQDGISVVECKGRVIQNYGYQDDEDMHMCHFVLHENGKRIKSSSDFLKQFNILIKLLNDIPDIALV